MAVQGVDTTLSFVSNVYKHTNYEDTADAEQVYQELNLEIKRTFHSSEGQKLVQKYSMLGKTVTAEGPFLDMIKIIWRMVKMMEGSPLHRLALLLIGIGTLIDTVRASPFGSNCSTWVFKVEQWLGNQLTIGGKGCTGDGEGSVKDRIQRFFSTPYLHDFD